MRVDPRKNIPTKTSTAGAWIQWHKEMKSNFPKGIANSEFQKAWTKRGATLANTRELREYMDGEGVKVEPDTIASSLYDVAGDFVDSIGELFTIGKWATITVMVIVIGSVGLLAFNIARKPIESARAFAEIKGGGAK